MDYQKELERMQQGGIYWKPKAGQFKVKALSELEETDPFISKREDGTEEASPQYKLKVLVNGEEKIWTMGRGATMASTHGQLVHLATSRGNSLINAEFTVAVKSDGKKNDYTIVI